MLKAACEAKFGPDTPEGAKQWEEVVQEARMKDAAAARAKAGGIAGGNRAAIRPLYLSVNLKRLIYNVKA
jgi:hypothetical protein